MLHLLFLCCIEWIKKFPISLNMIFIIAPITIVTRLICHKFSQIDIVKTEISVYPEMSKLLKYSDEIKVAVSAEFVRLIFHSGSIKRGLT